MVIPASFSVSLMELDRLGCDIKSSFAASVIEGALRKLVAAGELKKEGKGKNTCYFRLN